VVSKIAINSATQNLVMLYLSCIVNRSSEYMLHNNHNSATINLFVNVEVLTEVVMTRKLSSVCHLISRWFLARLILQP
jgi:hypothetical protein